MPKNYYYSATLLLFPFKSKINSIFSLLAWLLPRDCSATEGYHGSRTLGWKDLTSPTQPITTTSKRQKIEVTV